MKCIVLYGNVSVYITIKCVAGNAGVHSKMFPQMSICVVLLQHATLGRILNESLFPDSPVVIYQSRHSKITVKFQQMGSIPKHQAPPRTSGGWSWLPISIANIRL